MIGSLMRAIESRSRLQVVGTAGELAADYWNGLGFAIETESGERVTEVTALQLSTVWACGRIVASILGTTPYTVYRLGEGTVRTVAPKHPVYKLLQTEPNPDVTAPELIDAWVFSAMIWSEGYVFIDRDIAGNPTALWNMPPGACTLERQSPDRDHPRGRLMVRVHGEATGNAPRIKPGLYHPDNFLILRSLTLENARSVHVMALAREVIGTSLAAERFGATVYRNHAAPGLVVETDAVMNEDARSRFMRTLEERYTGKGRGRPMLLQDGLKAKVIPSTSKDAQGLESRQHQIREIARWFGVPSHKVGDNEYSTFNNVEQRNLDFIGDTLRPWSVKIQAEVMRKLFTPVQRRLYVATLDLDAARFMDAKTRAETQAIKLGAGTLTRDEARQQDGLNPLPGGIGEVVTVQAQYVPLAQQVNPTGADEGEVDPDPNGGPNDVPGVVDPGVIDERAAAFGVLVERVLRGAGQRWSAKAAEQYRKGKGEAEVAAWLEQWSGPDQRDERNRIRTELREVLSAACVSLGIDGAEADRVSRSVARDAVLHMQATTDEHESWPEAMVARAADTMALIKGAPDADDD